jgi:hypothetical protein
MKRIGQLIFGYRVGITLWRTRRVGVAINHATFKIRLFVGVPGQGYGFGVHNR